MDTRFSELIEHMQKHDVYFSIEDMEKITAVLKLESIEKKEFLLRVKVISKCIYFVKKGCLKVFVVDDKGEEKIVHFAVEDWWVGDVGSFITQTPARFNIQALEDSELIRIHHNDLEKLYKTVLEMERFFRIRFQKSFVSIQQRMLEMISKSGEERYQNFIKTYPRIEQRVPQYMVAAYLGLTPVFLSAVRKKIHKHQ